MHNLHFAAYGAMFLGSLRHALRACDALERVLPEKLLRIPGPPMADWVEAALPMRMHVLVRFGQWEEILQVPLPEDRELYAATTAVMLYARGVAYATLGRVEEARHTQQAFRRAAVAVPASRTMFNNTVQDVLAVADAMLAGELAYRTCQHEEAFTHLRRAVELDDTLVDDEPWGWMQPARHALGALLLEQGRVEDAEEVYRADLGLDGKLPRACQHPGNIWSLHGYHECLVRLGKHEVAAVIRQQLDLAAPYADVEVQGSCYWRLEHHHGHCT